MQLFLLKESLNTIICVIEMKFELIRMKLQNIKKKKINSGILKYI